MGAIWKDITYTSTASTLDYQIKSGDVVLYTGKATKMPDEDECIINVSQICQNYMKDVMPEFIDIEDEVITNENAALTFDIYSSDTLLESYDLMWDWSYEREGDYGIISEPINGKADPRQKLLFTVYSTGVTLPVIIDDRRELIVSPQTINDVGYGGTYRIYLIYTNRGTSDLNVTYSERISVSNIDWDGEVGTAIVTIEPNPTMETYTTLITFSDEYVSGSITVIQDAEPYINVSTDSIKFGHTATSTTVTVTSNISWVVNNNGYWLTVSPLQGYLNGTLTFEVPYTAQRKRNCVVEVSNSEYGITKTINVSQGILDNELWYTTIDDEILYPKSSGWGAIMVDNTYEDGFGVLTFDRPISLIPESAYGVVTHSDSRRLSTITFPDSIREIGNSAFYGTQSLYEVNLNPGLEVIGMYAFDECHLPSIILPDSLIEIKKEAFNKSYLHSITIPGSVQTMGERIFEECTKLTTVVVEEGVSYLPNSAFAGCTYLTGVTLPASVTVLNNNVFEQCYRLTNINTDKLIEIGDYAFSDCDELVSVDISSALILGVGVFEMVDQGYAYSPKLSSVILNPNLVSISERTFLKCNRLTNMQFPINLKYIGKRAYEDCDIIGTCDFPCDLEKIDDYAFAYCNYSMNIICRSITPPELGEYVFRDSYVNSIYVPSSSLNAYKIASGWSEYAEKIYPITE